MRSEAVSQASFDAQKRKAASASLVFNLASTLLKIVGAIATGSVSLLSEAIHSLVDVFASTMAYFGVRAAAEPPDEEHQYGHGKIESLAGFGESILLFLTVIYILYEAIERLIHGSEVQRLDLGMAIMLLSVVGSFLVGRYVSRIGRQSRSLALISNGQHLMVDFWTSVGVLAALALAYLGWTSADAIIAIFLAVWILISASKLAHQAFHELIDRSLAPEEIAHIKSLLENEPRLLSHHRLRTRRSGNMRYIDMHIVVPSDWTVVNAHQLADDLEKLIEREMAPAQVVIHVDPYDQTKTLRQA